MPAALMQAVPASDTAARDRMWAAVDQLTKASRRLVRRDDGTALWATVPSLWAQAEAAAQGAAGEGGGAGTGAASERNLVDLDLVAVLALVVRYTSRTLRGWGVDPAGLPMPAALRRLASEALRHDPEHLWWWEYRMTAWASLLTALLDAGERRPGTIRLRNAACPCCATRQVTVEGDDGPVVVPPLVIDFRQGQVRAATCTACGASWWRGEDLHSLAELLAS